MPRHEKQIALVRIEVEEPIEDVLHRIALLHDAFIRVITGTRLIEVLEADYEVGRIVAKIESRHRHPQVKGKVCIHYETYEDPNC